MTENTKGSAKDKDKTDEWVLQQLEEVWWKNMMTAWLCRIWRTRIVGVMKWLRHEERMSQVAEYMNVS